MRKALLPIIAVAALSSTAAANSLNMIFTEEISGSPLGGPQYASLTITEISSTQLDFTLDYTADAGAAGDQFLSELNLNIDPFQNATMTWTDPSISGYKIKQDGQNDSGAKFDYSVFFETANNGNRVLPGQSVSWSMIGTDLSVDMFNSFSMGAKQYQGLIHLQSIGANGDSAKVVGAVPEPGTMLAAAGLSLMALLRRRKKK